MTYKIRRSKSRQVQVFRGIETNQTSQHENVIDKLKSKIENLNLELRCKTYELESIKTSRDIENEVYSLIIETLLNSDKEHELSNKLVALDKLINNVINELINVFYTSEYSARKQQYK